MMTDGRRVPAYPISSGSVEQKNTNFSFVSFLTVLRVFENKLSGTVDFLQTCRRICDVIFTIFHPYHTAAVPPRLLGQ